MDTYRELYKNKCIVWDDISIKGQTSTSNYSLPFLNEDDYRWYIEIDIPEKHLYHEEIPLDDFHIPYRVIDRPERFTGEEYLKWLKDNDFNDVSSYIIDHARGYEQEKYFIRCSDAMPCPFPGGYCFAAYHDYGENPPKFTGGDRYFALYMDMDDSVYNIYGNDKEQIDKIWETISTVPDLTSKDVWDLGMG